MKTPDGIKWVDNFITCDPDTQEYIAWDETQATELGTVATKNEAIILCLMRALELANSNYFEEVPNKGIK